MYQKHHVCTCLFLSRGLQVSARRCRRSVAVGINDAPIILTAQTYSLMNINVTRFSAVVSLGVHRGQSPLR